MRVVLGLVAAALVAAICARHILRGRGHPRLGGIVAAVVLAPVLVLAARFVVAYLPGPSSPATETLRTGVIYERRVQVEPRPRVAHVLRIDLDEPGLRLAATRPEDVSAPLPYRARTTAAFVEESGAIAAINGDFFEPWRTGLLFGYPGPGDPVRTLGSTRSAGIRLLSTSASRGSASRPAESSAHIVLGPGASVSFGGPASPGVTGSEVPGVDVVGGLCMLVEAGAVADLAPCKTKQPWEVHPRSAVGLDAARRRLLLVVVDGRQPRYSVGAELGELAALLVELGAEQAMNLDGGGSSSLVARDARGEVRELGSPIAERVPGRARPVANHIGVFADL